MTSRILLLAVVFTLAIAGAASAADSCRLRARSHDKLGNQPGTPVAHVPKTRVVGAQSVGVHSHNRGKYPYVGGRKTPKRTYAM